MFFSCVDIPKTRTKVKQKELIWQALVCDQNFAPILDEEEDIDGNYCETWDLEFPSLKGLSKVFSDQK